MEVCADVDAQQLQHWTAAQQLAVLKRSSIRRMADTAGAVGIPQACVLIPSEAQMCELLVWSLLGSELPFLLKVCGFVVEWGHRRWHQSLLVPRWFQTIVLIGMQLFNMLWKWLTRSLTQIIETLEVFYCIFHNQTWKWIAWENRNPFKLRKIKQLSGCL